MSEVDDYPPPCTVEHVDLQNARVLVIGATGVLGAAVAAVLAERGARLVLTGRNEQTLARVAERTAAEHSILLDLLDLDACAAAVRQAAEKLGGLDGLVIATGVAAFGPARDEDDALVEELFAVNTLGPMAVIRAAAPLLGRGGSIVVLTAVLADVPTAGMAAYSASKAALSAYLTALRRELRRDQISVLDARPPHLDTGLADRALVGDPPRMPPGRDPSEIVALLVQGMVEGKAELVADLKAGTVSLR